MSLITRAVPLAAAGAVGAGTMAVVATLLPNGDPPSVLDK